MTAVAGFDGGSGFAYTGTADVAHTVLTVVADGVHRRRRRMHVIVVTVAQAVLVLAVD